MTRLRLSPLTMSWIGFLALVIAVLAFISLAGNPSDGEPRVGFDLKGAAAAAAHATTASVKTVTPTQPRVVNGNMVADPQVLEDSAQGPLPKIAANGRTPIAAYGRPFDKTDTRPRVAIIIGGLGIAASNTTLALSRLPGPVTLSFAPFGADVQDWVDKARGAGHEVLLEAPMEPFDFPDSDPGPNALLVGASAEENGKRLEWSMSRYTGYVGVTNLFGGRFLGENGAIAPVMTRLAARGLLFFDNGANPNSLALTAARHAKTQFATGTALLDAIQSPDSIDATLADLEATAREQGVAIGVGSPFPITIDRVADWAAGLEGRGLLLVPISALAQIPSEATPPQ